MLVTGLLRFAQMAAFTLLFWGLGSVARALFSRREEVRSRAVVITETLGLGLSSLLVLVFLLGFFKRGLTPVHLWIALGMFAALWIFLRFKKKILPPAPQKADRLFLVLLALLLVTRLLQIRALLVPNWVDGLNHVLLLERWQNVPALSSDRLYHAGFHMVVLALHALTGWDFPALALAFGQWLGIFAGLSLYAFLKELFGRGSLAFASAAVYSLFLLFPSYLISWGRYPLLQGLALLPFALSLTLGWLRASERTLLPALLALIALVLSHYGMAVFWGAFAALALMGQSAGPARWRGLAAPAKRLAWLVLPLVLALLPRLILLLQRTDFLQTLLSRRGAPLPSDAPYVWSLVAAHDWPFLALAALGLALAVVRGRQLFFVAAGWSTLVWGIAFVQNRFLGSSVLSYENVLIFLSLPISLLAGLAAEKIYDALENSLTLTLSSGERGLPSLEGRRAGDEGKHLFARAVLLLFLAAGLYRGSNIINPLTVQFTPADRAAMTWISANTAGDAVFLVNSAWWGDRYASSDGGGWIEPLTGRKTIFAASLADLAESSQFIRRNGVKFIYLGGVAGELDQAQFQDDPQYELVYHSAGVSVYAVR